MTESEEKVYVKVPTFDGRKSKWPFFKSKMISYLAQKNMSELLSFNGNIEKDDKTWSKQEMQRDEVKQVIRMRDMNRKASGVLLNCVDTEQRQEKRHSILWSSSLTQREAMPVATSRKRGKPWLINMRIKIRSMQPT